MPLQFLGILGMNNGDLLELEVVLLFWCVLGLMYCSIRAMSLLRLWFSLAPLVLGLVFAMFISHLLATWDGKYSLRTLSDSRWSLCLGLYHLTLLLYFVGTLMPALVALSLLYQLIATLPGPLWTLFSVLGELG